MKVKQLEADYQLFNIIISSIIGILKITNRVIGYLVKVHSTIPTKTPKTKVSNHVSR